jgi:hypothetical protein
MDDTVGTPSSWEAPAPQRGRSRGRIWATVIAVVLALGCAAGAGYTGVRALDDTTPVKKGLSGPLRPGASGPTSKTEADPVSGPRASSYPVRQATDLQRVCEQWYYPKSPKVTSAGTQPVSIFSQDSKDFDTRHEKTLFDIPNWYTAAKQKAWDPKSPAKVRLVGCVDLTGSGKKIKNCRFDDPKDLRIPMREGTYEVALYEVATGRKVMGKRLRGEDEECPLLVLLAADRTVYSQVGDRQLYELFKKYVEK